MILSAQSIRERNIITPFCERTVERGRSYGLSSCGYDVRVEFDVGTIAKMCKPSLKLLASGRDYLNLVEDYTFRLASTIEHFDMPDDVMGVVHDKSSWARQGLAVQNTIIEPGWRGHLTLELTFHGEGELMIYRGDPIAQIIFHQLDHTTEQPYTGKYQDQEQGPQKVRFE